MNIEKIANKIAQSLVAGEDNFLVWKKLKLKPEGSTHSSLENATLIMSAGYIIKSATFDWNKQHGGNELHVDFIRKALDGHESSHTFTGFNFGYGGEGPNGLMEFSRMFGLGLDEKKVFGGDEKFKKEAGEVGTAPIEFFK